MPTDIKSDRAEVGKKMNVDRKKADDRDLVVCSIKVAFPVTRELVAQLTGFPEATIKTFYNEAGVPLQHASLLMTKRELLVKGRIARHVPEDQQEDFTEPGKKIPVLHLPRALATDMRFVLENLGAGFRGTISWKARGDEVEDLEPLLGSKAQVDLEFSEPTAAGKAATAAANKAADKKPPAAGKAGAKKKTRGQDAAAGADDDKDDSRASDNLTDDTLYAAIKEFIKDQDTVSHSQLQDAFGIGFNRAHQMLERARTEGLVSDVQTGGWRKVLHGSADGGTPPPPPGVGPSFAKSVAAAAKRAPRKPAGSKRGSGSKH